MDRLEDAACWRLRDGILAIVLAVSPLDLLEMRLLFRFVKWTFSTVPFKSPRVFHRIVDDLPLAPLVGLAFLSCSGKLTLEDVHLQTLHNRPFLALYMCSFCVTSSIYCRRLCI
jgi:hypothetical protein